MVQIALEALELANMRPDLGAMPLDEPQHMSARGGSAIANPDLLPNLGES